MNVLSKEIERVNIREKAIIIYSSFGYAQLHSLLVRFLSVSTPATITGERDLCHLDRLARRRRGIWLCHTLVRVNTV